MCVFFFFVFVHLLQWKALAETEKTYYEELAEQDRQRYARECAVSCLLLLVVVMPDNSHTHESTIFFSVMVCSRYAMKNFFANKKSDGRRIP